MRKDKNHISKLNNRFASYIKITSDETKKKDVKRRIMSYYYCENEFKKLKDRIKYSGTAGGKEYLDEYKADKDLTELAWKMSVEIDEIKYLMELDSELFHEDSACLSFYKRYCEDLK